MSRDVPKSVAVIGAGISGVVAAAHLQSEGLEVTVFERSHAAGGVWLFDERISLEPRYPSIVASKAEEHYDQLDPSSAVTANGERERLLHAPPGPCYWGLMNNVGTRMLRTTLGEFPPGTPDFVSHSYLKEYIQRVARSNGIHDRALYNTKVESLSKSGERWKLDAVTLHSGSSGGTRREYLAQDFDYVVVASGHYHAARVPNIPGLAEWKRRYPHRVQHSKSYRRPEKFKSKNVVLIGGSVSSTDIARELGPVANQIYQSNRNGAFDLPASLLPDNAVRVDEITSFGVPDKEFEVIDTDTTAIPARITLNSGRVLCDIHHVIVCTGYNITLPFLPQFHSDDALPQEAGNSLLVTDGNQLHNLHKDIFYIEDPSLAFVGVPYFTATFTLFEFQAMVVAKVLAGQVRLPSKEAMRLEYEHRVASKGYGKGFHSLRDKEVEYVDELLEWVNGDLLEAGLKGIQGHTAKWHEAKDEQVARMKALFAGNGVPEREPPVRCG